MHLMASRKERGDVPGKAILSVIKNSAKRIGLASIQIQVRARGCAP